MKYRGENVGVVRWQEGSEMDLNYCIGKNGKEWDMLQDIHSGLRQSVWPINTLVCGDVTGMEEDHSPAAHFLDKPKVILQHAHVALVGLLRGPLEQCNVARTWPPRRLLGRYLERNLVPDPKLLWRMMMS
jgi:hypothetical protein